VTRPESGPITPIYLKTQPRMAWPDDTFFYVMTGDGLFVCRNHKFFRSCVPARRWPSALARQDTFLKVAYPKMPRAMIERIVGFFSVVADMHNSEAGVLLAWDEPAQRLHVVVPDQVATVSRNWYGDVFPIGLKYEWPADLPDGWVILGDVHSHVDHWPNPSYIDDLDETHRAGVHVVIGRIRSEPPEFHIEAVVDGQRFVLRPDQIMEDYRCRRDKFPRAWLDKVKIKTYGYHQDDDSGQSATAAGQGQGGNGKSFSTEADGEDHGGRSHGSKLIDVRLANIPEPDQYPDSDAKDQCPDSGAEDRYPDTDTLDA